MAWHFPYENEKIIGMVALTPEHVRELIDFTVDPPIWRLRKSDKAKAGGVAGTVSNHGYRRIVIDQHSYLAHRLLWFAVHGRWPTGQIDHINGNGLDNRIENLRDVDGNTNQQNRRTGQARSKSGGLLGVIRNHKRWAARIELDRKQHYLGTFDTPEEAHTAYLEAKRRLHPGCTI